MNEIKVGITGHRNILNVSKLTITLDKALKQLASSYKLGSIISPLAEGADRLVAEMLMDDYDSKLIVPMPFKMKNIKKIFQRRVHMNLIS
ncbi:MAG TPA: hypothetical protein EYH42_02010, partial [Sulfurovum sp.]|nr:hypothetical protein [Sulfurovum sp.]